MEDKVTPREFLKVLQKDHDATIQEFKEAESTILMLNLIEMVPARNQQEEELTTITRRYTEMCMDVASQRHDDLHMLMEATISLAKEMDEKNV